MKLIFTLLLIRQCTKLLIPLLLINFYDVKQPCISREGNLIFLVAFLFFVHFLFVFTNFKDRSFLVLTQQQGQSVFEVNENPQKN